MTAATHPQTGDVVLSAQGWVKRFGGITATGNVTLNLVKGARHALKAEKPGRGLVYGDAPSLPAAVSGKVASVACAPGCAFFAHDGEDHDGEEFKGAAGATLADLGVWTGRIRSAGISCAQ